MITRIVYTLYRIGIQVEQKMVNNVKSTASVLKEKQNEISVYFRIKDMFYHSTKAQSESPWNRILL